MVRIVTDSSSDLPYNVVSDLNIKVIPAKINFGRKRFTDGVDMSGLDFYERLSTEYFHPITSPASPLDFYRVFQELERENEDIIIITLPEYLSGFQVSARLASKYVKKVSVDIIDSGGVSMFQGLLVYQAAKLAKMGFSAGEIIPRINNLIKRTVMMAYVPTFQYLERGGRVDVATAKLGGLVGITPVLSFKFGNPQESFKPKGFAAARDIILIELNKIFTPDQPLVISVLHAQNPTQAGEIENLVKAAFNVVETVDAVIGPTIGANIGSGGMGVAISPILDELL
jgi:DegV family protein with EDD domain